MISCAVIRRRRITGIVTLSACRGSALGLSFVAGTDRCRENTNELGVPAVERWTWQLLTQISGYIKKFLLSWLSAICSCTREIRVCFNVPPGCLSAG